MNLRLTYTLTTSFVMALLRRTKQYLGPPPPPTFQSISHLRLQHILQLRLRPRLRLLAASNARRVSMDFAAAIPSRSTATRLSLATSALATPTSSRGPNDPGEVLEEWSSLIGIVTAIVGNVFIALALNVQRYAHTRLHKERARVRQRARAPSKLSRRNGTADSYGTISAASDAYDRRDGDRANKASNSSLLSDSALHEPRRDDEADPLSNWMQSTESSEPGELKNEEEKATSTYLKSPYWWLGQILITVGEMGNFLAYGFAPASIVSPLGVVALISNCIIAPVMFHERFRVRDFWGVVIAVAGVVTVVFSAKQEETKLEPHDVWDAITTTAFEIYLGVTISFIIVLMWVSHRYGRRTILIDLGLVGLFGGYTALATKGVSSMLSSTLWRAFATPVTYVLLFILLTTAVMQIRYVNKALQHFDSTQVIPIQFVLFTLSVILGSAILYRDFEKTTPKQAAYFVGGCLLTFFGVFLITSGRQQKALDDEDLLSEVDGIEENIGLGRHEQEAAALALDAQEAPRPVTPSPRSRRSSRVSRVSFVGAVKSEGCPDRRPVPALGRKETPDSAPHVVAVKVPPGTRAEGSCQESWSSSSSLLPRANMSISTEPAAPGSASKSMAGASAVTPPTRDPGSALGHPPEPPTTPRSDTKHSRTNSHRPGPRPFISPSPLSSTVSTVVKDGFLRDSPVTWARRPSLRRIRSSIRASLFYNDYIAENTGGRSGCAELAISEALLSEVQEDSERGHAVDEPETDAPRSYH
ncbi:hypothetical protein E4U17_000119 [Claviceps sp. LM77 group G4]|nr:hypothetical protein E4U17_000119 [Claviceps sp. LM77 group G4]KAG6068234.1 hypothetical protein E4U16_008008 [Claviceps sp. LM84 group G4]KAG6076337.1 hypothetical protein E4U33_001849 [Claviceps sp. LM78 group G4]